MICLSDGLAASLVIAAALAAAVAGLALVTAHRALQDERADGDARLDRVNRFHAQELAAVQRELADVRSARREANP
jgi:hypothetical protein